MLKPERDETFVPFPLKQNRLIASQRYEHHVPELADAEKTSQRPLGKLEDIEVKPDSAKLLGCIERAVKATFNGRNGWVSDAYPLQHGERNRPDFIVSNGDSPKAFR